jgi:diacylglycerol kinase (ATP)
MKYRIIANPTAGKGYAAVLIPQFTAYLQSKNLDFDVIQTERPGHGYDLSIQAVKDGVDVVVSAGGDGTMNEVLNGLFDARQQGLGEVIMGALPIGRGNDFSFGMGVPQNLTEACDALVAAKHHKIDLGRITGGLFPQGKIFGNGVGIGFDTKVGFEANKMAHLRGFLPYLLGALKTLFAYGTAPKLEVVLDNETITVNALMVSIMNGKRMGGAFMMTPKSSPEDGVFDLCIANLVSRPQILLLIGRFIKGTQESHPAIRFRQSKHVRITALSDSLACHADGETICTDGDTVTIELLPACISLIC